MKKLALKPGFALLLMEITFLCGLKPNAPDTELSGTEKRQLSNIYYKYFGSHEALSKELMANEMADKWPGGERKKTHECQRAIIETLHRLNAALTPAGPLDQSQPAEMDLSFVMKWLQGAKANEIIILTLATDVFTEVPVVQATHACTVNGKAMDFNKGEAVRYSDLFAIAYPGKDVVPGLTCTWSSGNDGGSLIYDGEGVAAQAGMHFNIISTSNA